MEQHGWSPSTCGKVLISRESNCTPNDFMFVVLLLGLEVLDLFDLFDIDVLRMLRMGLVSAAIVSAVSVCVITFLFGPVESSS